MDSMEKVSYASASSETSPYPVGESSVSCQTETSEPSGHASLVKRALHRVASGGRDVFKRMKNASRSRSPVQFMQTNARTSDSANPICESLLANAEEVRPRAMYDLDPQAIHFIHVEFRKLTMLTYNYEHAHLNMNILSLTMSFIEEFDQTLLGRLQFSKEQLAEQKVRYQEYRDAYEALALSLQNALFPRLWNFFIRYFGNLKYDGRTVRELLPTRELFMTEFQAVVQPEPTMHSLFRLFVSGKDPDSTDDLSAGILEKFQSGQYTSVWAQWLHYMQKNMKLSLNLDGTLSKQDGMQTDFGSIWASSGTFVRLTYVPASTVVKDLVQRTVADTTRSNLDDALSRVTIEGLMHTVDVLRADVKNIYLWTRSVQEYDEQNSSVPMRDFFTRRRSSTPSLLEVPAEVPTMRQILKELNYGQ